MLISQIEMQEMKNRYPDEKPTAFNYVQARQDFFRLAEAYTSLIKDFDCSTQDNPPCQSYKKQFIVLIDSNYVRDTQILPKNIYEDEEDDEGNPIDNDSAWIDFEAETLIGIYTACCEEEAINEAASWYDIHSYKLIAYQIA